VHRRGPVFRPLVGVVLIGAALLVVAGGLALRGPGLIAVAAAGVLAGCLAAGMAREQPGRDRWGMVDTAVLAGGCTIAGLLLLCGSAVLLGSGPTALVAGLAAAVVAVAWLVRLTRAGRPAVPPPQADAPAAPVLPAWWTGAGAAAEPAPPELSRLLPPVEQLTTRALGREWLRTTAALAGRLEPVVRASLVRRREDALDELERRDPDGFARWLAAGPVPGSDPADWLRTDSAGSPEAGPEPRQGHRE
jgi:hypothetical protein